MSGCVVWITGLPASGKTSLAIATAARLRAPCIVLDGDAVRAALVPSPGFDSEARTAFYTTLANLAALIASQGMVVLVPATAHRRAFREYARSVAPAFVEIYVDTPLEVCRQRDPKGLYRSEHAHLPGAGEPYEPPTLPDVVVHSSDRDAVARVIEAVGHHDGG